MKNYLIGKGYLQPCRDIVFMPSGGVRGTKAVCALVMGKGDQLPFAILDSDEMGIKFAQGLKTSLYAGDKDRVREVSEFVNAKNAETEDLFPPKLVTRVFDRYLTKPSGLEEDLADVLKDGQAIVPQLEEYAHRNGIDLEEGWKVEIAKRVKSAILRAKEDPLENAESYLEAWRKLFAVIHP